MFTCRNFLLAKISAVSYCSVEFLSGRGGKDIDGMEFSYGCMVTFDLVGVFGV